MTTLTPHPLRTPAQRLAEALAATCYTLGMTRDEVVSNGRRADAVTTREVFVLVARRKLGAKYQAIAAAMGRKDHGTVIVAYRRAMARLDRPTDWGLTYAQLAEEVEKELAGGVKEQAE